MEVKEIRCNLGVSVEIDGTWYKIGAGIDLKVDGDEDTKKVRGDAFKQAYNELEDNLEQRINELSE